MKLYLAR